MTDSVIKLKTRKFLPKALIDEGLKLSLQNKIETEKKEPHVMIQFKKMLSLDQKEVLKQKGFRLLNYIGSNTWYASVTETKSFLTANLETIKGDPILNNIRWMGEIPNDDKMAQIIKDRRIGNWARTSDGKILLTIYYFKDVKLDKVKATLNTLGARIKGEVSKHNFLVIEIDEQKISDIASEDCIFWIETIPPPCGPESDRIRNHVQANLAQNAPYNLTGNGINVGIFEWNHVWESHNDFSGRAIRKDATTYNPGQHTTMVAGIIGGNGSRSSANGGTANQWKGMAPNANLFSYNADTDGNLDDDYLDFIADLETAVNTDNIDVANNSWGTITGCNDFLYGTYEGICPTLDAAVRGEYEQPVTIVYSAGNDRDGYGFNSATNTQYLDCINDDAAPFNNYSTINYPKGAKNIIAVGAIDSNNDRMTNYSSWGPLADGRIKPDIVASGHHNGTLNSNITVLDRTFGNPVGSANQQGYRTPNHTTATSTYVYAWMTQTSCAAAVTTGCVALLLERYRLIYKTNNNPLPSTVKALLIHSALDLDDNTSWYNPGPDYASGYGLLQIKSAIDLVDAFSIREGKISTNRPDEFTLSVPAGATSVKVTLVWDDFQAIPNAANALVNDLDLQVFNPNNTQYFPWTLDPANPSNDAVRTVADHVNNVEQVFVNSNITAGTWRVVVNPYILAESPQKYSVIANYALEGKLDVIQVLDRSGSMGLMASSDMQGTKIQKLRDAASEFVGIMKPNVGNRLGIVQYNQDVVPFPSGSSDELSLLDNNKANILQTSTIPGIVHGGTTSIGDGLRAALNQFLLIPNSNNRTILLVTDGMENTPTMISDVQPDLISNDVTVYVLGLGYGSGINENKLVNLAQATGGTYRITSDHLVFQKLFIETLAGALDWTVINDPVGYISRGQEVKVPVIITSDQVGATFTAYWEGIDDAIDVVLISPSGKIISNNMSNPNIRFGKQNHYIYFQIGFPLSGYLAGEWAGEWKIKLNGTNNIAQNSQLRYSTSAFAESGPKLNVTFNKQLNHTGTDIQLKATLLRDGMPVIGAKLDVYGDIPVVGAGNVLSEGVSIDILQNMKDLDGDQLSLIDRKLKFLSDKKGENVLKRGKIGIKLYDDGNHGDGSANDGVYANNFTDTKIQGSYTFRFVASVVPQSGGSASTFEWTKSFFNEVNIQPKYSGIMLDQTSSTSDGSVFSIKITPKDILNNYLGPGYNVKAIIAVSNTKRELELKDNIDGTYTGNFNLSPNEVNANPNVTLKIEGNDFTTLSPFPFKKWSVSFHTGFAVPIGQLANDYKQGYLFMVDAGYHFSANWSVVSLMGFNNFKTKSSGFDNLEIYNLSANVKYYKVIRNPWGYYISAGPGLYLPKNGNTNIGGNLGFGLDYKYNSKVNFELGLNYNSIFDENIQFIQSSVGFVYSF